MTTLLSTMGGSSFQLSGSAEKEFIKDLSCCFYSDAKIASIIYDFLEKAESVCIEGEKGGDLSALTRISNLQTVILEGNFKNEPDIKSLAECSQLRCLSFMYHTKLKNEHFAMIAKFPSLESLTISDCSGLTHRAIEYFNNSKTLQILAIDTNFLLDNLKLVSRKNIDVKPQDKELLEDVSTGTSEYGNATALAARVKKLEEDPKTAEIGKRLKNYVDYIFVLALGQIPYLKKLMLYGFISRKEIELVRERLPRVSVVSSMGF